MYSACPKCGKICLKCGKSKKVHLVWVILHGQFPVGMLDLSLVGRPLHPQQLVEVSALFLGSCHAGDLSRFSEEQSQSMVERIECQHLTWSKQ